ncbi:hypothetical protein AB833_26780 [Chromatiales bacterium (ex Bugula neritina AB1)]|nr:hypothetical protein AB833_26780 [Chromatiales bacterium (ex Bugula neritina AB1)]
MNPLFFGHSKSPLYGVYHKPESTSNKNEGVLLMPPFGQEYMRSHRALRQLAMMLAKKGIPVLRFDYRGTGDSAGDLYDANPKQWVLDAHTAVEELKETAGVNSVCLVALRMSGVIACEVVKTRRDISTVILWDTVTSGENYLNELRHDIANHPENAQSNFIDTEGTLHYNGFALSTEFQSQLSEMNLLTQGPPDDAETIYLVSAETDQTRQLRSLWDNKHSFTYKHIDTQGDWNYVDANGSILLPQQIIQYIVGRFNFQEAA